MNSRLFSITTAVLLALCVAFSAATYDTTPLSGSHNEATSTSDAYAQCYSLEHFPPTLNTIAALGFDESAHLQGTFLANLSRGYDEIQFVVSTKSAVRAFVARNYITGVTLTLYGPTGVALGNSQENTRLDDVIVATIRGHTAPYTLRIDYAGSTWSNTWYCPSVLFELTVEPTFYINHANPNVQCPPATVIPTIDFSPLANGQGLSYSSLDDANKDKFNVRTPATTNVTAVEVVAQYKFTVPVPTSPLTQYWTIDARLGYDFASGGSLGLVMGTSSADIEYPDCLEHYTCWRVNNGNMRNGEKYTSYVYPGDYNLAIIDTVGEKDDSLAECIQFSLSLDIDLLSPGQNLLTCDALRLPPSLNAGGFIDESGHLAFAAPVFLSVNDNSQTTTFTVTTASFFRAYASEHKVDIDLKLKDSMGHVLAEAADYTDEEEGILMYLQPGDYSLVYTFSGDYGDTTFCDTFVTELALVPSDIDPWSLCNTIGMPDLSGLARATAAGNRYRHDVPGRRHHIEYNGNYAAQTVYSLNFTVVTDTSINAAVGSYFVYGDVEIWLMSWDATFEPKIIGTHGVNTDTLDVTLTPGNYGLFLGLTNVQTPTPDLGSNYPRCAQFTIELEAVPLTKMNITECYGAQRLPSVLNAVRYMPSPDSIYYSAETLIPYMAPGSVSVYEYSSFSVRDDAVIRVFADSRHIAVAPAILDADGNVVASPAKLPGNGPQTVMANLVGGASYQLRIQYFHASPGDHSNDDDCDAFMLEIATGVAPDFSGDTTCTGGDVLPTAIDLSEAETATTARIAGSFTQGRHPLSHSVPFHISTSETYMRAVIERSFLWDDVRLRLQSDDGAIDITGTSNLNYNEIETTLLPVGNYTLTIYEPVSMPASYAHCATFSLALGFDIHSSYDYFNDDALCSYDPLPDTFNSAGGISAMSRGSLLFNRRVMITSTRSDYVEFTLAETSVFRLYIPSSYYYVDVDMFLYNGTYAEPTHEIVARFGTGKESIFIELAPGDYVLEAEYYSSYPNGYFYFCSSYALEVGITPLSVVAASAAVSTPCPGAGNPSSPYSDGSGSSGSASPVPTYIAANTQTVGEYNRPYSAGTVYTHTATFSVKAPAYFVAVLGYDFTTTGLDMSLVGKVTSESVPYPYTYTYVPYYTANTAFIRRSLNPGDYTLTITDPTERPPLSAHHGLGCQPYSLYTLLSVDSYDEPPSYYCTGEELPPDISPGAYNSDSDLAGAFGGPQEDNGYVRIYGGSFAVFGLGTGSEGGEPEDQIMQFSAPGDVVVRAWVRLNPSEGSVGSTDNGRIDITVWQGEPGSTSDAPGSAVDLTVEEVDGDQGIVAFASESTDPYYIQLDFRGFDGESSYLACPSYELQVEIVPYDQFVAEYDCPDPMPTRSKPPAKVNIAKPRGGYNGYNLLVEGGHFADGSSTHNDQGATLDIEVHFDAALAEVSVAISFDFAVNAFDVFLYTEEHELVVQGDVNPTLSDDDADRTFISSFTVTVEKGTYAIRIVEHGLGQKLGITPQPCHSFDLSVQAVAVGGSSSTSTSTSSTLDEATVLDIQPYGAVNLDATKPLVIEIEFTQPIDVPDWTTMASFVAEHHSIYISTVTRWTILPDHILLNRDKKNVRCTWDAETLRAGEAYRLHVPASGFKTADGEPFRAYNDYPTYGMSGCDCNGHGSCISTSSDSATSDTYYVTLVCECDSPFAGPGCADCIDGYHMAGTACVENVPCSTASCSGHGTCSDASGYPECTCDAGYASEGDGRSCNACGKGFSGYPDCEASTEEEDRSVDCLPPLLPRSLNGVAYLGTYGSVHMQDVYYVDALHPVNDIGFTLDQESVFRVYVTTTNYVATVKLYEANSDGSSGTYLGGDSSVVGGEATLFLTLPGADNTGAGTAYRLIVTTEGVDPKAFCPTIELELAIIPTSRASNVASAMSYACGSVNVYPDIPTGSSSSSSGGGGGGGGSDSDSSPVSYSTSGGPPGGVLEVPPAGFSYNTDAYESVTFSHLSGTNTEDMPNFFYSFSFQVPNIVGKKPHINANLGYDFALGDMALLIEEGFRSDKCQAAITNDIDMPDSDTSGSNTASSSSSSSTAPAGEIVCITGQNNYNTHVLDTDLVPGSYTLWIYEPVSQDATLTDCVMFEFDLSITYEDLPFDPLACPDYQTLPTTLNAPGYIDAYGFMEVFDDFIIPLDEYYWDIDFTVKERSLFRLFAPNDYEGGAYDVSASLRNSTHYFAGYEYSQHGEESILVTLEPGAYSITYYWWSVQFGAQVTCPSFTQELALMPLNPPLPPSSSSLPEPFACTGKTRLPSPTDTGAGDSSSSSSSSSSTPSTPTSTSLPDNTIYAPASFGTSMYSPPLIYYSQPPKQPSGYVTIKTFTVEVEQPSRLTATVGSDFLTGDMEVWVTGYESAGSSSSSSWPSSSTWTGSSSAWGSGSSSDRRSNNNNADAAFGFGGHSRATRSPHARVVSSLSSAESDGSESAPAPSRAFHGHENGKHMDGGATAARRHVAAGRSGQRGQRSRPQRQQAFAQPSTSTTAYSTTSSWSNSNTWSTSSSWSSSASSWDSSTTSSPTWSATSTTNSWTSSGSSWAGSMSTTATESTWSTGSSWGSSGSYGSDSWSGSSWTSTSGSTYNPWWRYVEEYGTHGANYNGIEIELQPGTYTVYLNQFRPNPVDDCVAFTFDFDLQYLSSDDGNECEGIPLPTSFATPEFLSVDDRMHVQSSEWVIQYSAFGYSINNLPISVRVPSLLRLYVEPQPDTLVIMYLVANDNPYDYLASGWGVGVEQSIVYELEATVEYNIHLAFVDGTDYGAGSCFNFAMEMAVTPIVELAQTEQCQSGGDRWPQSRLPSTLPGVQPFTASETSLYVQQRVGAAREFRQNFIATAPLVMYVKLDYNFVYGDMVALLRNHDTGVDVVGINGINRNVLAVDNVAPGNYTLIIYEPADPTATAVQCSHFNYDITVGRSAVAVSTGTSQFPIVSMPDSLNTVPYLDYHNVHMVGDFASDVVSYFDTVTLELSEQSLVRVFVSDGNVDVGTSIYDDSGNLIDGSFHFFGEEALVASLAPGSYNLYFSYSYWWYEGWYNLAGGSFLAEVAVVSAADVSNRLASVTKNCVSTPFPDIEVDSNGRYALTQTLNFASEDVMAADVLGSVTFELTERSRVYVWAGFDFVLNDVGVSLEQIGDYSSWPSSWWSDFAFDDEASAATTEVITENGARVTEGAIAYDHLVAALERERSAGVNTLSEEEIVAKERAIRSREAYHETVAAAAAHGFNYAAVPAAGEGVPPFVHADDVAAATWDTTTGGNDERFTFTRHYSGLVGRNTNELSLIVSPGSFNLTLYQASGRSIANNDASSSSWTPYGDNSPNPGEPGWSSGTSSSGGATVAGHCVVVDLVVDIEPAAGSPTVCHGVSSLPSSLSSGATKPFGGPVVNGVLNFAAPAIELSGTVQSTSLTVGSDSMLRVATTSNGAGIEVSVTTTGSSSGGISPLQSVTTDDITNALFYVPAGHGVEYIITFTPTSTPSVDNCPSFELIIELEPVSTLQLASSCPVSGSSPPPPTGSLPVNSAGFGSTFNTGYSEHGKFVKSNVLISVTQESVIQASIAFDSLVSVYSLKLTDGSNNVLATGVIESYESLSGSADFSMALTTLVRAGTYTLSIIQSPGAPLPPVEGREFCYPYEFHASVYPVSASAVVAAARPFGANDVSFEKTFTVALTLTAVPYVSGSPATGSDVAAAFVLESGSSTETRAALAGAAMSPVRNHGSDVDASSGSGSGTHWELVFTIPELLDTRNPVAYSLSYSGGLVDANGNSFTMVDTPVYTTVDPECSGHGAVSGSAGCSCDRGYAGLECDVCAFGYSVPEDSKSGECKASSDACTTDYCGCKPGTQGDYCVPLGTCEETSEGPVCHCQAKYGGDVCEVCAEGRVNYPDCTESSNHGGNNHGGDTSECLANCVNGDCDDDGKCVCKSGFTGDNCDTKSHVGKTVAIVVIALVLAVGCVGGLLIVKKKGYASAASGYLRVNLDDDDDGRGDGTTVFEDSSSGEIPEGVNPFDDDIDLTMDALVAEEDAARAAAAATAGGSGGGGGGGASVTAATSDDGLGDLIDLPGSGSVAGAGSINDGGGASASPAAPLVDVTVPTIAAPRGSTPKSSSSPSTPKKAAEPAADGGDLIDLL